MDGPTPRSTWTAQIRLDGLFLKRVGEGVKEQWWIWEDLVLTNT